MKKIIVGVCGGEDEEFEGERLIVSTEFNGDYCILTIRENTNIIAQFSSWEYWREVKDDEES